jgi:hypothetical protein
MPKNLTGGSKNRGSRSGESDKARKNRQIGDALIDDYLSGASTKGVYVGRVTKKFGHGRMEVFVVLEKDRTQVMNVPLRGGLKGKGKQHVWVDTDSVVIVADNDVGGYEIIAVLSSEQKDHLKRVKPDMDARIFAKGTAEPQETGFEFDQEADVDIDTV